MKNKWNYFFIIGLILFTQCKKEESNDPAPVVKQLVKDLSLLLMIQLILLRNQMVLGLKL